ncbi:MAG: Glu/Leu/Phe/Val dehydrogenase [Chloroflexi bacterium]|nr:Glu/Leu/Phe/Val dehydrogenase [Chloroflexota bacterium]
MKTMSVFETGLQTLNQAGEAGEINPRVIAILQAPKRIQIFRIPLKRDDGSFQIHDAYRVHYNNALGPYSDGTRVRPGLTLDEVKALGLFMTIKHCATNIPRGGAKGGIAADPGDLTPGEYERLIRAFVRCLSPKGPWMDVPGADIGTGEQAMSWMLDEYEQITGQSCPAAVNDKPPILGGSLGGEEATGRGCFLTLLDAAAERGLQIKGATAVIQGFGQVGSVVARCLHEAGSKVLAVSDIKGGVVNESGLDIPRLLEYVKKTGFVVGFAGGEALDQQDIFSLECDIAVPAAVQNVINQHNAGGVKAKIVVEAANGPITADAEQVLQEKGVWIVPDVIANAGGATVCHFEMSQGLYNHYWDLDTVTRELDKKMHQAYLDAAATKRRYQAPSLRIGAWISALKKLEKAMTLRGWV